MYFYITLPLFALEYLLTSTTVVHYHVCLYSGEVKQVQWGKYTGRSHSNGIICSSRILTILLPGHYQRLKTLLAHTLFKVGSKFVYYPEVAKLWLIFKEDFKEKADRDSSVKITSTGRRHFGTATGKISFKEEKKPLRKDQQHLKELQNLCKIAKFKPQVAFTCFITC